MYTYIQYPNIKIKEMYLKIHVMAKPCTASLFIALSMFMFSLATALSVCLFPFHIFADVHSIVAKKKWKIYKFKNQKTIPVDAIDSGCVGYFSTKRRFSVEFSVQSLSSISFRHVIHWLGSVLQCAAVCCSALQCVAVCCKGSCTTKPNQCMTCLINFV